MCRLTVLVPPYLVCLWELVEQEGCFSKVTCPLWTKQVLLNASVHCLFSSHFLLLYNIFISFVKDTCMKHLETWC